MTPDSRPLPPAPRPPSPGSSSATLCLIPARGGSKRIPRKNVRPFCGRPIIEYPVRAAVDCGCFDEVMVSTDNTEFAEVARLAGASVPFLRSAKASDDLATTADVIVEVLDRYAEMGRDFEVACCLYAVTPLVTARRLADGFRLLKSDPAIDSVVSILRFGYPIQRALRLRSNRVAMFYPEHENSRSQDLEPAYHDAGQFYWFRTAAFRRHRTVWMPQTAPLPLDELEAQDIDTEDDWRIAELKWRMNQERVQETGIGRQ